VCVYSAQFRVRLLLVCVQCTVQSETVTGVFTVTVQSETVTGVCVQCTVQSEIVTGVCTVHSAE